MPLFARVRTKFTNWKKARKKSPQQTQAPAPAQQNSTVKNNKNKNATKDDKGEKEQQKLKVNNLIFERDLVRTPYGRIQTMGSDNLDMDDVEGFMDLINKFEFETTQVVKVKYIVNEILTSRYNAKKQTLLEENYSVEEKLVFHGTRKNCIDDIIQNGFKIGGLNGHRVANGTSYGYGIYTDINGQTAAQYSKGDFCVIASKGLIGEIGKHTMTVKDAPSWLIFKESCQVLPCYVVYFERDKNYEPLLPKPQHFVSIKEIQDDDGDDDDQSGNSSEKEKDELKNGNQTEETNSEPKVDETSECNVDQDVTDIENKINAVDTRDTVVISNRNKRQNDDMMAVQAFFSTLDATLPCNAVKAIQKQLMRVLKLQMNLHPKERGWIMDVPHMERLDVWNVRMVHFDPKLPLVKDLSLHKLTGIDMVFTFKKDYPASPPFVRVVYPRMLRFQDGGGGHVEAGGAICVEMLTQSGWDPKYSIEGIFQVVHALLSTTEPPARLAKNWEVPYTESEAMESFVRVAKIHNWMV